jgi:flagellar motor switch protein FliN/FliY
MGLLGDIEVDIKVELGAAIMPIHNLLRMGRGAVIELDTTETDAMRIYANKTLIARGDISVDDGQLRVVVTEKVRRSQLQR